MNDSIYLKYRNNAGVWSASQGYSALITRKIISTERAKGTTKRGVNYAHLLHTKSNNYTITISADQLIDSAKKTFIDNFYSATGWKFSDDNFVTETEMVLDNDGAMGYEYIGNSRYLPKITLNLLQKYPD